MRLSPQALLVAPLLVLPLLVGCGGDDDGPDQTITYWANPLTADPQRHAKTLEPLLEEFTEETGIGVDLEMQDWTKVYPKIIAGISSGTLPDVFDTGATWAAALQATGGLMDWDAAAFAKVGGRDRFLASSLASTGVPGPTSAAVPLVGQAYGLFYNPKLFAKAGIDGPPQTWAELVKDARKLTKRDVWGIAVGGAAPLFQVHQAFALGRQEGGRLFSPSGKPTFDTDAGVAAVRRLLDLMATEHVVDPTMIEKNGVDAVTAFGQGKAAMVIAQSAAIGLLKTLDFDDYAVAQIPLPRPLPRGGAPVQSMVAGTNLAVAADSEHRDAAIQLVEFLTAEEQQVTLNEAFGTLPVLTELQGVEPFDTPALTTFGEILARHSEPMPLVPSEGAMELVLGPELVKLWPKAEDGSLTDADIRRALRAAEEQMPKG